MSAGISAAGEAKYEYVVVPRVLLCFMCSAQTIPFVSCIACWHITRRIQHDSWDKGVQESCYYPFHGLV